MLEENCELLLYLDKNKTISDMQHECLKFVEDLTEITLRKFPPLRYYLEIDMMKLLDEFPKLGQLLLDEPVKWREMCRNILYSCLLSNCNDTVGDIINPAQVNVVVRVKCVPQALVNPNSHQYKGLVSFRGILIDVSQPSPYVMHSVWSCPEECEHNEVILNYIPKTPPRCLVCRSVLFENSGLRRCGEEVQATLTSKNNLLCRKFKLTDDCLPDRLKLGSQYSLLGVVIKKSILIWSVEALNSIAAPVTMPVPSDIANLLKICDGIPWKFIYCLASSIGIKVCPLNCFMHLKICLLLSLASVRSNSFTGCSIVHVLAAGFDSGYVGALMREASHLANQAVCLGTTNTIVSTALIASTGGITVLPSPLHSYNQKQISTLLSAIESNEIATEYGRVRLQSAVWTHGMDMKKTALFNIASVFGTVCRGDLAEYTDEIIEFMLQQSVECVDDDKEEKRAMLDLSTYLDGVAGVDIGLSDVAESLLKNYFLSARRQEGVRGISVGSMSSLVATSLASARLCRRTYACVDDAVFAIWLHASGAPEPRCVPDEYLQIPATVKMLHINMNKFKEWLERYIGNILVIT